MSDDDMLAELENEIYNEKNTNNNINNANQRKNTMEQMIEDMKKETEMMKANFNNQNSYMGNKFENNQVGHNKSNVPGNKNNLNANMNYNNQINKGINQVNPALNNNFNKFNEPLNKNGDSDNLQAFLDGDYGLNDKIEIDDQQYKDIMKEAENLGRRNKTEVKANLNNNTGKVDTNFNKNKSDNRANMNLANNNISAHNLSINNNISAIPKKESSSDLIKDLDPKFKKELTNNNIGQEKQHLKNKLSDIDESVNEKSEKVNANSVVKEQKTEIDNKQGLEKANGTETEVEDLYPENLENQVFNTNKIKSYLNFEKEIELVNSIIEIKKKLKKDTILWNAKINSCELFMNKLGNMVSSGELTQEKYKIICKQAQKEENVKLQGIDKLQTLFKLTEKQKQEVERRIKQRIEQYDLEINQEIPKEEEEEPVEENDNQEDTKNKQTEIIKESKPDASEPIKRNEKKDKKEDNEIKVNKTEEKAQSINKKENNKEEDNKLKAESTIEDNYPEDLEKKIYNLNKNSYNSLLMIKEEITLMKRIISIKNNIKSVKIKENPDDEEDIEKQHSPEYFENKIQDLLDKELELNDLIEENLDKYISELKSEIEYENKISQIIEKLCANNKPVLDNYLKRQKERILILENEVLSLESKDNKPKDKNELSKNNKKKTDEEVNMKDIEVHLNHVKTKKEVIDEEEFKNIEEEAVRVSKLNQKMTTLKNRKSVKKVEEVDSTIIQILKDRLNEYNHALEYLTKHDFSQDQCEKAREICLKLDTMIKTERKAETYNKFEIPLSPSPELITGMNKEKREKMFNDIIADYNKRRDFENDKLLKFKKAVETMGDNMKKRNMKSITTTMADLKSKVEKYDRFISSLNDLKLNSFAPVPLTIEESEDVKYEKINKDIKENCLQFEVSNAEPYIDAIYTVIFQYAEDPNSVVNVSFESNSSKKYILQKNMNLSPEDFKNIPKTGFVIEATKKYW